MKKSFRHGLLIFSSAFIFNSCSGFLTGGDFTEQLEKDIEYEKSASYSVIAAADENTGVFTDGAGRHVIKVSDSFDVEFKPSSSYKFISWKAVDADNQSVNLDDYVFFSNETELRTTATLTGPRGNILIKPECLPYLEVTDFSPLNRESGVSYNSDIKITFSEYMSESAFSYSEEEQAALSASESPDEFLTTKTFDGKEYAYAYKKGSTVVYKNIAVKLQSGLSITHYFNPPVITDGKKLLLSLRKDCYDAFNSLIEINKTLQVNVEVSPFVFDTKGISFADNYKNLSFSYQVNSSIIADTAGTDILFETDSSSGTISPSGLNKIYTELSYTVSFTPSSEYFFKEWGVFYALTGEELPYGSRIVNFESPYKTETGFTLTSAVGGIMIKPVCKKRPALVGDFVPPSSSDPSISLIFSKPMREEDFKWSSADLETRPVREPLRDSKDQIYGYVSNSDERIWRNIEIFSSDGQNLLEYFDYARYSTDGTQLIIPPLPGKQIPAGTYVFVKISKGICDAEGIPFGNENEYIELNYKRES